MKIDLLGQGILILAVLLLAFFASGMSWTHAMLALLGAWQLVSAFHLFYAYRHVRRLPYLRTALVVGGSLPVWIFLIGELAYLPVAGLILWYFVQTIRDTITVFNRPRSFWDLM